eukprot:UN27514
MGDPFRPQRNLRRKFLRTDIALFCCCFESTLIFPKFENMSSAKIMTGVVRGLVLLSEFPKQKSKSYEKCNKSSYCPI